MRSNRLLSIQHAASKQQQQQQSLLCSGRRGLVAVGPRSDDYA